MNVKEVVALFEVGLDLREGKKFYDEKEKGVGGYFWDSLIADIESLLIYGGIHNKHSGFFRMFAKRFPYAIYYDVQDDTVIVVAVLPMRRDPAWIEGKLSGRTSD